MMPRLSGALLLVLTTAPHDGEAQRSPPAQMTSHSPPPPACPPQCGYNSHFKGCGVLTQEPNGSSGFHCPPSLLFSAGFDSDMVLQRAPQKAKVYGQMLGHGAGATVQVTVSAAGVAIYTVPAAVAPDTRTYCQPSGGIRTCVANYSAVWSAYLKPAPAGGEYTISAKCTAGCGTGTTGAPRDTTTLERVTFGDVYFCSGQSNMALPGIHSYSAKTLQQEMLGGKYSNLRYFQFEGMGGGKIGDGGSYTPIYARQTGAHSSKYPGNGSRPRTWVNATYGAAFQKTCPKGGRAKWPNLLCPHPDLGPFFSFSATCMEVNTQVISPHYDLRGYI